MKTRLLLIDENVRQRADEILRWAQEHPYTMDDVLDVMNKQKEKAGHYDEFTIRMYDGFRAVYSEEDYLDKRVKHLSVSVNEEGMLPSIEAVSMIMTLFKFKAQSPDECDRVFMEDIGENHSAVNLLEIVK